MHASNDFAFDEHTPFTHRCCLKLQAEANGSNPYYLLKNLRAIGAGVLNDLQAKETAEAGPELNRNELR